MSARSRIKDGYILLNGFDRVARRQGAPSALDCPNSKYLAHMLELVPEQMHNSWVEEISACKQRVRTQSSVVECIGVKKMA